MEKNISEELQLGSSSFSENEEMNPPTPISNPTPTPTVEVSEDAPMDDHAGDVASSGSAVLVANCGGVPSASWKALFGHLRSHKIGVERERGVLFPDPPVFTPPVESSPERGSGAAGDVPQDVIEELLVPTLLHLSEAVLLSTAAAASSPSRADGLESLDIGLNQPGQGPDPEKKMEV
ncbi:hypothetical protein Dsin_011488 [Dipteronia sinensis]|uniref:Uncharacterized protein n=1 Tax=Dipteronia sinensis TaxID=43782 RepID=A0AAE0AV79_9ROSI|nr:hypothetical protein Dsin_011488 [Dipteronia sinensis]